MSIDPRELLADKIHNQDKAMLAVLEILERIPDDWQAIAAAEILRKALVGEYPE